MTVTSTKPDVRRITGHICAQITTVDLATELDGDTVAFVDQALLEQTALIVHGAPLTNERQERFGPRPESFRRRAGDPLSFGLPDLPS